ncbi:MAG: AraC family transcriptional regulator [Clostridia bacterium]
MLDFYELARDETHRTMAWHIDNNQYFAHFHSTIELIYVESGVLCAMQDGVVHLVEQDHLIVNSCYMLHSYSTPEYSRIIVVTIPLSTVPALRALLTQHSFLKGIVNASGMEECRAILRMMADPAHAENSCFVNSLGSALLSLLIEKIGLQENVSDAETDLIKRILSYLQEHAQEAMDVETAAAHFGYSAGRFSHIFNQSIGCSFTRYVSSMRCRMAQRMLEAEDLPLTEVASACGFSSLRTFHRVYKAYVGHTPRGEGQ